MKKKSFVLKTLIVSLIMFCLSSAKSSYAQSPADKFLDSMYNKNNLLGSWGGGRTFLHNHGIDMEIMFTQFYQEMPVGQGDRAADYGGKPEIIMLIDGGKLGLWNGFEIITHAQLRYGDANLVNGGSTLPHNTSLLMPKSSGTVFDISNFTVKQEIIKDISLMAGKFDLLDITEPYLFFGKRGITSFMNAALAAPPNGLMPLASVGALLTVNTGTPNINVLVFDHQDASTKTGLDNLFGKGVSVMTSFEFPFNILNKTSIHSLTAIINNRSGIDLKDVPQLILPPEIQGTINSTSKPFCFTYTFQQFLSQSSPGSKKGWGVFGSVSVTDGNPTYIKWFMQLGLGGTNLVPGRPNDHFGMGYFYYGYSEDLKNNAISRLINFGDESGVEFFYNFAATPWLMITTDFQLIDPALKNRPAATILGLRGQVIF